jgi:molecular chaperone GrpE
LLAALAKEGLERIDAADVPFDPQVHDAVAHDETDNVQGPVVEEVLRAGYRWKGVVLRPAMVKVLG